MNTLHDSTKPGVPSRECVDAEVNQWPYLGRSLWLVFREGTVPVLRMLDVEGGDIRIFDMDGDQYDAEDFPNGVFVPVAIQETGAAATLLANDIALTEVHIVPGEATGRYKGEAVALVIKAMAQAFAETGGVNFVEFSFNTEKHGPMTMTMQRQLGKSPGLVISDLKRELAEHAKHIAEMRALILDSRSSYADAAAHDGRCLDTNERRHPDHPDYACNCGTSDTLARIDAVLESTKEA